MAQTSSSKPISAQAAAIPVKGRLSAAHSLALRRMMAWALEVGLVAGSVALPWGLGEVVRRQSTAAVPLTPAVTVVQGAIARSLGWSRQRLVSEVPPLTNLLWFSAVVAPVGMVGSQVYGLARRGKTWPKDWLGLQVVRSATGSERIAPRTVPGLGAILGRELGRWGVPLVGAYGLWIGSGVFPSLPWLGGLALAGSLGAGLSSLTNPARRTWYDTLVGTQVLLLGGGQIPSRYTPEPEDGAFSRDAGPRAFAPGKLAPPLMGLATEEYGGLTAIVLAPADSVQVLGEPGWRRYLPVAAALAGVVVLGGLGALWLDQRLPHRRGEASDALFLALVENLSQNATSFSDRQAAALALASSEDPRAIPLLVDLLAQTGDPGMLDTLQQALVTLGPPAIPALQRLNLALANDLLALPPEHQLIPLLRQRTVKRTLAKLLVLHSGQLNGVDLSGTYLGYVADSPAAFTLVLENQHLAGIIWRNAVLAGARLRKAKFFDPGPDGRPDTFDDWMTDFSGSDLTEASLVAAHLRHANFRRTSLLRANLSNALAAYADFSGANASSAWLIAADVSHGRFVGTSLVGADLTDANLTAANLVEARLHQAALGGATLHQANLTQADLSAATLKGADLSGAILRQVNLSDGQLGGANLEGANLEQANLQGADLEGVTLSGANLAAANLAGARFFTPVRSPSQSFFTTLEAPEPTQALAGVDFSKTLNLRGDQLEYVCRQGGLHPACPPEF
jgi:uncharacterized protein YjbI with pentapeptide repeats